MGPDVKRQQILIAASSKVLRLGLRGAFADDPPVAQTTEVVTLEALYDAISGEQPDLLIVDQALKPVWSRLTAGRFVVLARHPDFSELEEVRLQGGRGYLSLEVSLQLLRTLPSLPPSAFQLDPTLTSWLFARTQMHPDAMQTTVPLTQREQEVAHLLAQGYTRRQIAQELSISLATVKRTSRH